MKTIRSKSKRIALLLTTAGLLAAPPACTADAPATAPASAPATMPAHTNRLAKEKSPYLLQHAHNPVDWYPWGQAAFDKARKENKPIFLSIGYSTCHWCHVMERESFENEEVAKLINDHFVPIKVDREERPDVDRVYMTFVQATTGSGGWPMTVFLTPDLQPFFGGTYFPPADRGEMTGMKTLLPRVAELWRDDKEKIVKSAGKLTEMLKEAAASGGPATRPGDDVTAAAPLLAKATLGRFEAVFDEEWGGFGRSPKFPEPVNIHFLFRYAHTAPDAKERATAKAIAIKTLDAMAAGGIHDHVGGGFHRYSTDQRWFLPHFEKMLYDQGQLVRAYVDAWRITKDQKYADVARDVLEYVLRDLTGPEGQFYCAEDADSARDAKQPREKVEGAFYVWSVEELEQVLGKESAAVVAAHFGVKPKGNVELDRHGDFVGRNILFLSRSVEATAKELGKSPAEVSVTLASAKDKLLAARSKRVRPHLDDKTLTAWSGLMISGFAHAGAALDEPRYEAAAVRAATFLRAKLYDEKTHTLKRGYREGQGDADGFLEDYAFLVQGLLDLYESTLDSKWLAWAIDLQSRQDALFWDAKAGGYFSSPGDDPHLLVRMKDDSDGAEPSGNSVAAMNLLRLAQMTDDAKLAERAKQIFTAFASRLRASPLSLPYMLMAADFASAKPRQIVIAGTPGSAEVKKLLAEVQKRYVHSRIILCADGGAGQALLVAKLPFIKEMKLLDGKAAAYVCQNYACQQPTADAGELGKQLEK